MNNFLVKFFATGFFIGYIPKAPGTFATFLAATMWWFLPKNVFFIVFILISLIAIVVCGNAEKLFCTKDDQKIVIDEVVGYFFAVVLMPKTYFILLSSIILFRFFDIKKPFFIKSVQKLKGSAGILADDLLSGIIVNFILQTIIEILNS
ncbi:MAG: phosphatidylglycerophosphatase A [Elusimicrobiota bacterium]